MAWIILEGLDRTGKSTVSEHFQKKNFIVHHMEAPSKKYLQAGYVGPSYFEEVVDMYMAFDGKDVIFDRSPYGELIWPKVYGRDPQLSEDDFEFLREYEDRNDSARILMYDDNKEAHWKRCVDNKEPLTRGQFNAAVEFFNGLANQYGFTKRTLPDFKKDFHTERKPEPSVPAVSSAPIEHEAVAHKTGADTKGQVKTTSTAKANEVTPLSKLDKANAINKILGKPLIKYDGEIYEELEVEIRQFLQEKLDALFGNDHISKTFDELDVQILKRYCAQVKSKLEAK